MIRKCFFEFTGVAQGFESDFFCGSLYQNIGQH